MPRSPEIPQRRQSLDELLDSLPEERRPGLVWGQVVSHLPDTLDDLRQVVAEGLHAGATEIEMSQQFIAMLETAEDPDALVRQLPYSEGAIDGKPAVWIHFILPESQTN